MKKRRSRWLGNSVVPSGGAPWVPPWVLQNGWYEFPEFSMIMSSPESLAESTWVLHEFPWVSRWVLVPHLARSVLSCNVLFFSDFSKRYLIRQSVNFFKFYYFFTLNLSSLSSNLAFPLSSAGCLPSAIVIHAACARFVVDVDTCFSLSWSGVIPTAAQSARIVYLT